MNASPSGLTAATIEKIRSVFAQHPRVAKAVLYGSRAIGNFKNGSDIDLTLMGDGLDYDELMTILDELDELLLPYTIDLSIFEKLDHAGLREHIQRVGMGFYERAGEEGGCR
jgi:predicted nucleotidyltransferase